MTDEQKQYLIDLIENGQSIPEDFKTVLFPNIKAEYELNYAGKMRKEDILANEDGTFPVPLQVENVFGDGDEDAWRNLLVFGDNLQFLKTVYEDKDPIIAGKIKGKVKLIYIDPPFATENDFNGKDGEKAYADKKQGSEFIEFLRRRLIMAREILADDGLIFVHLDWKKVHYIKIVMDEVFGENNFLNDIVWFYKRWNIATRMFARNHDVILCYKKNSGNNYTFNNLYVPKSEKSSGNGKAWQSYIDEETGKRKSVLLDEVSKGVPMPDVWEISMINPMAKERKMVGYPTQKPEALLERIILAATNPGDIVLDFFAGSGTTITTAEKLGRRWVGCDIGKLSFYIIQKRLLQLEKSKKLDSKKNTLYGKKATAFMTCTLGAYDLKKALELEWSDYGRFVSGLFEFELKETTIKGVRFEGKKRGSVVKIFNYHEFSESSIDEEYLKNLHAIVGKSVGSRVYIVAPANYVDFLSDYYEIENVRYYFLKIPYHMINELHKAPFVKIRQPKSAKSMNGIEEAIGFHFNRVPDVKARYNFKNKGMSIVIDSFNCNEFEMDKTKSEKELKNEELLAMILIDSDYDGNIFSVTDVFFKDEFDKEINVAEVNNTIMVKYIDIYGNEFSEEVKR